MSDEEQTVQEENTGAPAWVMTFADLMSLLMCFFVLLLAFSEMDVEKFKQLSGSMKHAFGVQRDIKADEIPRLKVLNKLDQVGKKEAAFQIGRKYPGSILLSAKTGTGTSELLKAIEAQVFNQEMTA